MVTIPRDEYDRLREAAEDLVDLRAYDRAKADLASGRDELVPSDYADRILEGESPLRVWRDQIGRASCRERVCQYGSISVVAVCIKQPNSKYHEDDSKLFQI